MRQRADRAGQNNATMVKYPLEFGGRGPAIVRCQMRLCPNVNRHERQFRRKTPEFVGSSHSQFLNRFCGRILNEEDGSANGWQIVELHQGIVREALCQVVGKPLRVQRIRGKGQRNCPRGIDIPIRGQSARLRKLLCALRSRFRTEPRATPQRLHASPPCPLMPHWLGRLWLAGSMRWISRAVPRRRPNQLGNR